MTQAVLSLTDLVKSFGKIRALDRATVEVPTGPVGLLGPNGAGKTTLIKVLLGLLVPDSGKVRVLDHDPRTHKGRLAIRRVVGYMPEGDCLLPGMTGVELVAALGRITGMSRQDAMTRAHEALDYVGLDEERYRGLEEYSTGMKQRLKLAQALVHDPGFLLLDEPTNGLDPKGRRHMLELVHDLGHVQGKNLLLCSHLLPDVETTCDHVVVLDHGRVARAGSIREMTAEDGRLLRLSTARDGARFADCLRECGYRVVCDGNDLTVHVVEGEEDADRIFAVAAEHSVPITSLAAVRSTLEEIFLQAVGVVRAGASETVP
jgi:ABC-2 type transport system ATP-binding protein